MTSAPDIGQPPRRHRQRTPLHRGDRAAGGIMPPACHGRGDLTKN